MGTIKMPPGAARTITVLAFETNGEVSYEGHKTIDVKPGENPPVSIPMTSRGGHVPITVQLGTVGVTISPTTAFMAPGATNQFSATIRAADGTVITEAADWATNNPAVATVSTSGLVTAIALGHASIIASFDGIAAVAQVSVETAGVFGNSADLAQTLIAGPDMMSGNLIDVTSPITVNRLCVIVRHKDGGAGRVRMALYDNATGDLPGQLLASTAPIPVTEGRMEMFTSLPVVIPAGRYWLLAVYDQQTYIGGQETPQQMGAWVPQAFDAPLPSPPSGVTTALGVRINYYLKGT
jgi:hypothetical protein